jgi:hypothetical protein
MGYVAWTDAEGSTSLSNGKPHVAARRFTGFVADVDRVGDERSAMGTGMSYDFLYRRDYTARVVIDHIPVTNAALWLRFKDYAMQGCAFYLHTEDSASRTYLVRRKPGTAITIEMSDPSMLEYRLTMEVISAASPAEPLLCFYRE